MNAETIHKIVSKIERLDWKLEQISERQHIFYQRLEQLKQELEVTLACLERIRTALESR